MIGHFCLNCWLGECGQVLFAHLTPVTVADCACCRRRHDWTDAHDEPVLTGIVPADAALEADADRLSARPPDPGKASCRARGAG